MHTHKTGPIEDGPDDTLATIAAVGPRLRALRQQRGVTLADLAESTGISVSTLSRLESGQRRATLQLLLPLAQAHRVPLDDLVGAPPTGDPRVHLKPIDRHGRTYVPLTQMPGPLQAFKLVIRPGQSQPEPNPKTHEGFEWLYVLSGRLRLVLGEHDVVMGSGEAAEFDTRVPHWFSCADDRPVECLCLFGKQGERVHLTASPRR
ncbi:MAG: cupin domain-containing protein [Terracoccus sp.]